MTTFELVEYREPALEPGQAFTGTEEQILGTYPDEAEAIAAGRAQWRAFRSSTSRDVAWWIVKVPGEDLARWIADGASATERVLDLTSRQLIEVK